MPSLKWPYTRVSCALAAAVLGSLASVGALSGSPTARAATEGQLQQQISAGQSRISSLSGSLNAVSGRLAQINSSIAGLQSQIAVIQADLDRKRGQLIRLRSQLDAARTKLAQLEALQARGQRALSKQLVNAYESDRPDIINVVLEARGFRDLLERVTFAQRIRTQDVQVVHQVRSARRAVALQATRLGALEVHQQTLTQQVLTQRNALARVQVSLVQQQLGVAQQRSAKANQLAGARNDVAGLQQQLSRLQAAQAAAAAAQAAAAAAANSAGSSSGSGGASSSPGSSGGVSSSGFAFPLPTGTASPPNTWSLDQGVDISAPGGTSEFAVCSGTIVLHGIGGFGPWAPVLHCDNPIGGYSYVYYGHAGPANQLAVGTHVGAGQVMSEIGPGIVGFSTGPHLEIGFSDASGTPVGGGSASTMMSLLQGSYRG